MTICHRVLERLLYQVRMVRMEEPPLFWGDSFFLGPLGGFLNISNEANVERDSTRVRGEAQKAQLLGFWGLRLGRGGGN